MELMTSTDPKPSPQRFLNQALPFLARVRGPSHGKFSFFFLVYLADGVLLGSEMKGTL